MPAHSRGGTRSLQSFLGESFFPAPVGGWQKHNQRVQSHAVLPTLLFIGFAAIAAVGFFKIVDPAMVKADQLTRFERWVNAAAKASTETSNSAPAAVVPPASGEKFDWVYNPPFALSSLDSDQRGNYDLVGQIPNDPASQHLDLLGFSPIGFDWNEKNWFQALAGTEASLRQVDPTTGSLIISDAGCVGLMQGCDLNICPKEAWEALYTNIWCGARAFKEQLRVWDENFTYAVAGYKGAWLYELDANGGYLLDENGNRIITRDDAGNPKIDPQQQEFVDRVVNTMTKVASQN